jgi:tetrapyrrole methylase family protein / MazG family protein
VSHRKSTKFTELKKVFAALHGPKGCLWDKKQTYTSLIPHFREEAGELIEAVRGRDYQHMKEELGDILLFVMFYSQIASKDKRFDVEEVIDGLIKKLKRRHPHVFGGVKVNSSRQIIINWNKIKSLEKKAGRNTT